MNHFIPIPFFLIAFILLYVGKQAKFKTLVFIAKFVIITSFVVFIYEYAKFLGYNIVDIIFDKLI